MPIASMTQLLARALRGGYAVGYFESWDQYSLEAALEAAEETASPIILGIGGSTVSQRWLNGRGLEEMILLARSLAERSAVPTAILLNEVKTLAQVFRGLQAGCNAVMLDSSHLPMHENIAATRGVVEAAHLQGAAVEGELGRLAQGDSVETGTPIPTEPAEAAQFVESTGVDALAVSVGNVHLLAAGTSPVDLERLAHIRQAVSVPLVIHGGTGFPSWAVRPAIERGVAKFNVGTGLKQAFLVGVREGLARLAEPVDLQRAVGSRKDGDVLQSGKEKVKQEIMRFLQLYGCAGQAGVEQDMGRSDPHETR